MGNWWTVDDSKTDVNIAKRKSPKKHKNKKSVGQLPENFTDAFVDDSETGEFHLWDDPADLSDDGVNCSDFFDEDTIELERKGKTMSLFKEDVVMKLEPYLSQEAREQLLKLGTFRYRKSELTSLNLDENKLETLGVTQTFGDVKYIGQAVKNKDLLEGRCIAVYPDGSLYEGFCKNNQRHGAGRMIYVNGDVYQGIWSYDKWHQYGVFISSISSYKGNFKDGAFHGKGFEISSKNDTYRGDYYHGVKQGKGKFIYSNQSVYEGDVKHNERHGFGKYTSYDGKTYEGEYFNGKMNGKGQYTWPNGTKYIGEYVNNKKEGKGIYYFRDGKVYDGDWKNNKQEGIGLFIDQTGKSEKLKFVNGHAIEKIVD